MSNTIVVNPNKSTKINAPSYALSPEGNYSAVLTKAVVISEESDDCELIDMVRITFTVEVPWIKNKPVFAWKTIKLSTEKGNDFRKALIKWLGKEFVREIDQSDSFDLNTLVGKKAELTVKHSHNKAYENPLVIIEEIRPVGSLALTTEERKAEPDMGVKRLEKTRVGVNFMR
jgi:hypothetical protein